MRTVIRLVVITGVLLLLSVSAAALADDSPLRGKAFGDPTQTQEMEPGWAEKPIIHDPALGKKDLVISLSQQFYDVMLPQVEKYAREKKLNIEIRRGTCGISAGMLTSKQGDVGAFCCPPAKTDRLPGLHYYTLGLHPISILVNPENPIDNLTLSQVRDIFQGKVRRWSELGWKDQPIRATARLHCKKRPGHWRLLLDNADLFGMEVKMVGAIEDMFSIVADNAAAIGYEVLNAQDRQDGKVKAIRIDGYASDDFDALLSGKYPLYRALYLTVWEGEHLFNPHARDLVDFLIREMEIDGRKAGIVPLSRIRQAGWKFLGDELVGGPE